MDPLERSAYQIVAEVTPLEVENALYQLKDMICLESKHLYEPLAARKQVFSYIQKKLVNSSILINLFIFEITVQIIPGKSVDIFIRVKNVPGEKVDPPESVYSEKIL